MYDVYEWPKNVIYIYDVTTLHTYYSHLGVKNWDTNFKFGMRTTLMCVLYIYYGFLKILKSLDFRALFPEKLVFFVILGVKIQKNENPR